LQARALEVLRPPFATPEGTKSALNTQADADRVRAENLAAERSAMAKLGWDPGLSVSTPFGSGGLKIVGTYNPRSDVYWYLQQTPSASMHESMHRGIDILRNMGLVNIPKGSVEERYVRALMQRAYGNVEIKELRPDGIFTKSSPAYQDMEAGKAMVNDPVIENLEKVAADEIARRHPRGPR
jgi:hypothetical protein